MNLALLLPAGLAALVALALPLLIHLARRTEQRPTDFAALRWLRPKPRPRHRPRFDERLLLAIRMLLLTLLAVWLARPVLWDSADGSPVIAVVPGAQPGTIPPDARGVWLAPGFPKPDGVMPAGVVPMASLLRQLDAELPAGAALTVLVPQQLVGADAERPKLSRPVTWRVMGSTASSAGAARAPIPALVVRHATNRAGAVRYFRAAAIAWAPLGSVPAITIGDVDVPLPGEAKYLVWMAPGDLPSAIRNWIAKGGVALVDRDTRVPNEAVPVWRDIRGASLVDARVMGRGRVLRFVRPLRPDAMPELLDPDFADRLLDLLSPPAPAPSRVLARDYQPHGGGPAPEPPSRDLQQTLALAIAALWIVERGLATRQRRAAAP